MGCSSFIVRNLLFLFNFIFVVAGLGLLVLGILTKLNLDDVIPDKLSGSISTAPIILITVGSSIFILAFLGCCGAIRESTCMLTMYAIIILGILIMQIVAGVMAFMEVRDSDGDFKLQVFNSLRHSVDGYYNNNFDKEYMDLIQQGGKCCGSTSSSDYQIVPSSCCENNESPCRNPYKDGCGNYVYDQMKSMSETIGKVALGLCCTELVTIVFSLCLVSSIKNERRRATV